MCLVAYRKQDAAAVEQLLQLGASPFTGSPTWESTAWHALRDFQPSSPTACEQIVGPFLRHGLNVLSIGPTRNIFNISSLLSGGSRSAEVRHLLLQHLEGLRTAGQLQFDSKVQAAQLVRGAAAYGVQQLVAHGIAALEGMVCTEPGADDPTAEAPAAAATADAIAASLLDTTLRQLAGSPDPAPLAALLASSLPLNLQTQATRRYHPIQDDVSVPLLAHAALGKAAALDKCRLLYRAGAPLSAGALYACIDELLASGVAALLACGTPAVDASQPDNRPEQPNNA